MCVVSFVPARSGVYLTSNRDERRGRPAAEFPCSSGALLYPRDGAAGGSWIALNQRGEVAVLLNGAYVKHAPGRCYRRSRGLVLLEIAEASDPLSAFGAAVLDGVEPFTLVLYGREGLYECRWDGIGKHRVSLALDRAHVWSSSTLYDAGVAADRERRFAAWKHRSPDGNGAPGEGESPNGGGISDPDRRFDDGDRNSNGGGISDPDREKILDFHRGEVLKGGDVSTVSITSVFVGASGSDMKYYDLRSDGASTASAGSATHTGSVELAGSATSTESVRPADSADLAGSHSRMAESDTGMRDRFDRWLIRLGSWEYWPFGMVYAAPILYWIWLSVKARSLFFFSTANPTIENAGFLLESKLAIYDLMPAGSYPRTVYCKKMLNESHAAAIEPYLAAVKAAGLAFPLIAKPDIGQRGMQVSLLRNACELYVYNARSRVDYLLQEYIDYPNEVGIFYYRRPGEATGHISGIVGKELLRIVGDGVSTVEELLRREDRFRLQLSSLRAMYGQGLREVPRAGEDRLLVPFGNHSRGARFLDWSDRITPALETTIDALCRQIPGFYFGRLDIRFLSWEDLYEGRNFSVIELNGAGSEPTHMYDPRHSIFFAWKEICRHFRLLFDISRENMLREGLKPMRFRAGLKMLRDYSKYEKQLSR